MSLTLDYPVAEVGDADSQLEAWRIDGANDSNTDRGVAYAKIVNPGGGNVTVELYSDRARESSDLVASGTGSVNTRISLTSQNGSGMSGSVKAITAAATSAIELVLQLATRNDIEEREDRIAQLLLEDPAENDFDTVLRATMRQFLLRIQYRFPPVPLINDPLNTFETLQPPSPRGRVERFAEVLWRRNGEENFELVGLQNPGDWKEWAILDVRARLWDRRSDNDPTIMELKNQLMAEADRQWEIVQPWVDIGLDKSPDRIVRTKSLRIGRG